MDGPMRRLRAVLRGNALATGACGVVCLAGASPLADLLAVPRAAVVAVGALFVLLAVDVAVLAGRRPRVVVTTGRALAVVDAAWAAGSVVAVAAGLVSPVGALLVLAVAAVTAGFAVAEGTAAGRLAAGPA